MMYSATKRKRISFVPMNGGYAFDLAMKPPRPKRRWLGLLPPEPPGYQVRDRSDNPWESFEERRFWVIGKVKEFAKSQGWRCLETHEGLEVFCHSGALNQWARESGCSWTNQREERWLEFDWKAFISQVNTP